MNTLKNKMIISYFIISLLIVVALSTLFNLSIDKIFEQYAIGKQKQQIEEIIDQVKQQYEEETGLYHISGLEVIANAALQNGILVHIQTINNEIDWDIQQHKAQECQVLLQHAATNMNNRYPDFKGGYAEDVYDLKYNDVVVGYLKIGYYGPYSLGDNELLLINSLNRSLMVIGIVFLFVAIGLGIFMAKRISSPITSAIRTAQKIADGNYGAQIQESSATLETTNLITAINEMSKALAIKEQQKKQITDDVAHELRTPLSNLQGNMEALIDDVWEPTKERLQVCYTEILRLTVIVEQLQELNLLESNYTFIHKDNFDFSGLCNSLFNDFELKVKKKGVSLLMQIPSTAPVYGDINRLKQCMLNLVSNAISYTATGGSVTIEYEKVTCGVILRVCDTGVGIPTEDLLHIFERFYRVDKSRNHMSGGVGIGLSITKAIIIAHGGTISVESFIGSGTAFSIFLPDKN